MGSDFPSTAASVGPLEELCSTNRAARVLATWLLPSLPGSVWV